MARGAYVAGSSLLVNEESQDTVMLLSFIWRRRNGANEGRGKKRHMPVVWGGGGGVARRGKKGMGEKGGEGGRG